MAGFFGQFVVEQHVKAAQRDAARGPCQIEGYEQRESRVDPVRRAEMQGRQHGDDARVDQDVHAVMHLIRFDGQRWRLAQDAFLHGDKRD